MGLLKDKDREAITERLKPMDGKVKLVFFTQELECDFCRDTHNLLSEVVELSDKLEMEVYNLLTDAETAAKFKVEKVPALALVDENDTDFGIRYYGIPSGYEFASLLDDILMISEGDSGLSESIRETLKSLRGNVHLQVFVTPTCPYCPGAVRIAHQMAYESEKITADMVEATEFPHLSNRYNVRGVPRTIINEDQALEGMRSPEDVLSEVLRAG